MIFDLNGENENEKNKEGRAVNEKQREREREEQGGVRASWRPTGNINNKRISDGH